MTEELCSSCGEVTVRHRKQVVEFYEFPDGSTETLGWGELKYGECCGCGTIHVEENSS